MGTDGTNLKDILLVEDDPRVVRAERAHRGRRPATAGHPGGGGRTAKSDRRRTSPVAATFSAISLVSGSSFMTRIRAIGLASSMPAR